MVLVIHLFEKLGDLRRPKGKLEPSFVNLGNTSLTSIMDLNIATDAERQSAYFMSGGLVAAHSTSRKRESIWDASRKKRGLCNIRAKNSFMV